MVFENTAFRRFTAPVPKLKMGGKMVAQGQHHNGVETFRALPSGRFLREPPTLRSVKEHPKLFSWGVSLDRQCITQSGAFPPRTKVAGFRACASLKRSFI